MWVSRRCGACWTRSGYDDPGSERRAGVAGDRPHRHEEGGDRKPLVLSAGLCFRLLSRFRELDMGQPGFFDVDERLARLSSLGDQLETSIYRGFGCQQDMIAVR